MSAAKHESSFQSTNDTVWTKSRAIGQWQSSERYIEHDRQLVCIKGCVNCQTFVQRTNRIHDVEAMSSLAQVNKSHFANVSSGNTGRRKTFSTFRYKMIIYSIFFHLFSIHKHSCHHQFFYTHFIAYATIPVNVYANKFLMSSLKGRTQFKALNRQWQTIRS